MHNIFSGNHIRLPSSGAWHCPQNIIITPQCRDHSLVTLHNEIPKSQTYEKVTGQNVAQIGDNINIYVGEVHFQDVNWMEICRMWGS